ncbi:MAG TPA: ROK family protein [Actinomycetota bacterium]|nr:ROK family protein [Actinomycetota bacterium]
MSTSADASASVRRLVIGVDTGGTATKGALVTSDGEVQERVEYPTDHSAGTKGIVSVVDELLDRASDQGPPLAVGVGVAGFVDLDSGSVTFSPNVIYDDPHVTQALAARTKLPIAVDNDANAAVWGERRFGVAQGFDDVAMVTIGTGIGSGFVVSGRVLRGANGAAAEAGHTVVEPSGPECPCGLKGCLEQLASGNAIARIARAEASKDASTSMLSFAGSIDDITTEHVAKAARQMDEAARSILRTAGRYLGIGLSNIVNMFDPEIIVLAGSVTGAGEPFLGPARDQLAQMTLAQRRRPVRLDVSKLGPDAGIVGAACLAFDLLESQEAGGG